MNALLMAGSVIVCLALIGYAISMASQIRRLRVTNLVLGSLLTGVALDATATGFMIAGSRHGFLTVHGVLGYIAFGLMLADLILIWKFRHRSGKDEAMPSGLRRYSKIAFCWWVLTFLAGGVLAARVA
jgi:heme/copper-type cytochrome/quinol oxidase subunit 2